MAWNVRMRNCNTRVTIPFNEKFRSRILSSFSSATSSGTGSDHNTQAEIISSSSSSLSSTPATLRLSHLVLNFLENNNNTPSNSTFEPDHTPDSSDSDSDKFFQSDPISMIRDVINPIVWSNADPFRSQLLSHATKASEIFAVYRSTTRSVFNRNLMAYLREIGYNAGICKTKWDSSAGGTLTAGNYEFIDVIRPNSKNRYIIDAEFAGEFEIARESENYKILRMSLPRVFVGQVDDLKKIIRLLCDEARRSMKINGLTLPPWRKNRYMQTKWLGAYRRTTNYLASSRAVSTAGEGNFAVKCRSVGFDVTGNGGRFSFPPVTRTR